MKSLRVLFFRFAALFHRSAHDRDFSAEINSHLQMHVDENLSSGMDAAEARRQALIKLGGAEQAAQDYRARRSLPSLETLAQDIRYALRTFVRTPAFFVFTVAVLALGIGANTAIFTVAYNVLLRPLPYHDASHLVIVWEDDSAYGFPANTPSPGNYAAWRARNNVFTDVAAMGGAQFNLTGKSVPLRFIAEEITSNMFPLLGVKPELGRNITAEEDKPGANHVVILSHGVWMADFSGDANIVGKTISLNNAQYTVIGVMPRGFIFPDRETQIWTPAGFSDKELANHGSHYLNVVARLKDGVSLKTANADLAVVAKQLQQEFPVDNAKEGAFAEPLRDQMTGSSRTAVLILLGAVGFVLLIACANVANLLLARATRRRRELAMRMALGAGRRRIIRQLLTESILLSVIAGLAGLFLAIWATPFLAHLVPATLAPIAGSGMNTKILLFLVAVSILCGVLFGLAPAVRISRIDLASAMKQGGARSGSGAAGSRMRDLLVVSEIALALVLFSAATLMVRSFMNVRNLDPGFRPAHVLAVETDLPSPKYENVPVRNAFFQQTLDRINHLPGVVAAGCTTWLPLTNWGGAAGIMIEGRPDLGPGHAMIPNMRMVSDKYMDAIGMRLIQGRSFNAGDAANTPRVALINEAAAKQFWSGANPIGTRFNRGNTPPTPWVTVVGIVADVHQAGLDVPARPEIYLPYDQYDFFAPSYFAIRTAGDPMSVANAVREQIWAIDKDQPVTGVMPLEQMLSDYLAPRELQSSLLGGFAGFALLLAALGIYAVLAFTVTQRTQEIGVRVALGAQQSAILRNVLSQGLKLAGIGVAIGVGGALALSQLLSTLLFGLSATDPLTLCGAVAVLLVVALTACYIPARRAMRVDPMIALRYE